MRLKLVFFLIIFLMGSIPVFSQTIGDGEVKWIEDTIRAFRDTEFNWYRSPDKRTVSRAFHLAVRDDANGEYAVGVQEYIDEALRTKTYATAWEYRFRILSICYSVPSGAMIVVTHETAEVTFGKQKQPALQYEDAEARYTFVCEKGVWRVSRVEHDGY